MLAQEAVHDLLILFGAAHTGRFCPLNKRNGHQRFVHQTNALELVAWQAFGLLLCFLVGEDS